MLPNSSFDENFVWFVKTKRFFDNRHCRRTIAQNVSDLTNERQVIKNNDSKELIIIKTYLVRMEVLCSWTSGIDFILLIMASDEKNMHEAYTVCPPASLPVQIESLACYGM